MLLIVYIITIKLQESAVERDSDSHEAAK